MESLKAENEAITKYQFNKEQIALSLPLYLLHSLSLSFLLFLRVKRMTCYYQSTPNFTARVLVLYQRCRGSWQLVGTFLTASGQVEMPFLFFIRRLNIKKVASSGHLKCDHKYHDVLLLKKNVDVLMCSSNP